MDESQLKMSTIELVDEDNRRKDDIVEDKRLMCGLGNWRPSWLQKFANLPTFTVTLSLWLLFCTVHYSYYPSIVTTIEKQFGMSSSLTGIIKNIDNIGYTFGVIFFNHFCRYSNKPRLFTISTIVSASAIFLFAVPHLIYGVNDDGLGLLSGNTTEGLLEVCDGLTEEDSELLCQDEHLQETNMGAVAFFVVSELVSGVAESPKYSLALVYTDDNAQENRSALYFALMFAMRAASPVMGFMLGAWTTSIYVDLTDPGIDQKDPRWIGAWWVGYIIIAASALFWTIPLILFPSVIRSTDKKEKSKSTQNGIDTTDGSPGTKADSPPPAICDDATQVERASESPPEQKDAIVDGNLLDSSDDFVTMAKDLPRAICRLVKNRLLILLTLVYSLEVYTWGYFTFVPKYLEQYFGLTASKASIYAGNMMALAIASGPLISGVLISWQKWKIVGQLRFMTFTAFVATIGYVVMMFLDCPEQQWSGQLHIEREPELMTGCNGNCSCDTVSFVPLCAENVNYYSPCHAGCPGEHYTNGTTQIYTGCQCVPDGGVAESGMCGKACGTVMIIYMVMQFICKLCSSMAHVPQVQLCIRIVDHKDKALSIGLVSLIVATLSFPSAVVFGLVIDTTCLILQGTCEEDSREGACLFYDESAMRFNLHLFISVIRAATVVLLLICLCIGRNYTFSTRDGKPSEDHVKKTTATKFGHGDAGVNVENGTASTRF